MTVDFNKSLLMVQNIINNDLVPFVNELYETQNISDTQLINNIKDKQQEIISLIKTAIVEAENIECSSAPTSSTYAHLCTKNKTLNINTKFITFDETFISKDLVINEDETITLLKNTTYRLSADLNISSSLSSYVIFSFFDNTNDVQLGNVGVISLNIPYSSTSNINKITTFIKPNEDIKISLKINDIHNSINLNFANLLIQTLN